MDDEPMSAADRVVALTPGSAITILETANEFVIKDNHLTLIKGNQFDVNWDVLNRMGCDGEIDDMLRIRLREAGSDEEIFTSVALGIYHVAELDEEGFNVYFEGGLRSDEHFNAQEYWLSISREEILSLSRSHASTIKYPVLRVIHKMITNGLCQMTTGWIKRKGAGMQKESQICCGKIISKIARKSRVLIDDVLRSLSTPVYCRDLNTTTVRELIEFESRLIPEDPQPGVPGFGIPRPPRASMHDLYDRISRMEIRQEAIERMEYRHSYHLDMYQGVFEHMVGVYSVPL
nr:hypothetical protein [Tanacetum cinerariifolium]